MGDKQMTFNCYYVDKCEQKDISQKFINAVFRYSDAFSLIYFQYEKGEKMKKSTRNIKNALNPYKLESRTVLEWPGTITMDNRHIYRMITYRTDKNVLPILLSVDTIWDWNYSRYPMDPAFYKNGYAWFYVTSHEHINQLYLREDNSFPSVDELESLGVKLIPDKSIDESCVFYNKHY
jgi:hypothetical protein